MLRTAARFCLLLIAAIASWECYLLHIGYGQMDILQRRRSIDELRQDVHTAPQLRQKLEHIEEARRFARDRIGLEVGDTYRYYSELDRSSLAWNLSASQELSFRAKSWWFPIVGRVPYLGFFDRRMAEEEAAKLDKEGWDVKIRAVAAYSSLGWFDDPLVSPQLDYPDWYLTILLIHESSHATLWFPGDVNFNESFASFVGETGALQFHWERGSRRRISYHQILSEMERRKRKRALFRRCAQELERLYSSAAPREEKLQKKRAILKKFVADLKIRGIISKDSSRSFNNADLLSYRRYQGGSSFFKKSFASCKRDWACFLKEMGQLQGLAPPERAELMRQAGQQREQAE